MQGKFVFVGERKLYVRGVTYGPFASDGLDASESDYHDEVCVERDFAAIAASGANCVRTYTLPPPWLLDIARAARVVSDDGAAVGAAHRISG